MTQAPSTVALKQPRTRLIQVEEDETSKTGKRWRYYLRRFAYRMNLWFYNISREKYDEKVSATPGLAFCQR